MQLASVGTICSMPLHEDVPLSLPVSSKPVHNAKQTVKHVDFVRKHRARRWVNVLFSDETTVQTDSR